MRNLFLIIVLLTSTIHAQETCESKEDVLEDLNSITKCTVKESTSKNNKSRQISVKVSASKKRFLKKRIAEKKAVSSDVTNLSSSGISNTNHTDEISNSLSVKKETPTVSNITTLTNSLSAEEIKKAEKFSTVTQIPLFENCKAIKKNKSLDCFNVEMIKHIQKHFQYPHNAVVNKIQGEVWVRFIIDKDGNVTNIKTLGTPGGGKILDDEARRVVSKLPKFIPGLKEGNKASVKYGFPITFSLEE